MKQFVNGVSSFFWRHTGTERRRGREGEGSVYWDQQTTIRKKLEPGVWTGVQGAQNNLRPHSLWYHLLTLPTLRTTCTADNQLADNQKGRRPTTGFRPFLWNEMKWNVGSPTSNKMKWNERFTHFSSVDVKWKLMKLFFTNDREMRWNEVKIMKFSENQQKDLLNSIKSQSSWTYPTFRPRDLFPHLKDLLMVLIVVKCVDTPWTRTYVSVVLNSDNGVSR